MWCVFVLTFCRYIDCLLHFLLILKLLLLCSYSHWFWFWSSLLHSFFLHFICKLTCMAYAPSICCNVRIFNRSSDWQYLIFNTFNFICWLVVSRAEHKQSQDFKNKMCPNICSFHKVENKFSTGISLDQIEFSIVTNVWNSLAIWKEFTKMRKRMFVFRR